MRRLLLLTAILSMTACGPNSNISDAKNAIDNGDGTFTVSIPENQLIALADPAHTGKQQKSNWCWAAVSQMILNYHHLEVTQVDLVEKLYGDLRNEPAEFRDVEHLLNGWTDSANGGTHVVHAESSFAYPDSNLVSEIEADRPMLVGVRWSGALDQPNGHAYMLYAVDYTKSPGGQAQVKSVHLIDPRPEITGTGETLMNGRDFRSRILGMVTVSVPSTGP